MPTYQYACKNCGHGFEIVQSFSDPSLTECPECKGALRKVFNSVGVVFKGSGFYRNDSRNGNTSTLAPETKPASTDSGISTTSSDSKPAAKTEAAASPAAK